MAQIEATLLQTILHYTVTDDGAHILAVCEAADGSGFTLALPTEEAWRLIDTLASGATTAMAKTDAPKSARAVFDVKRWEAGLEDNSNNSILSLTVGTGGRLSFRMNRLDATGLRDALVAMLGPANTQTPETPQQKH